MNISPLPVSLKKNHQSTLQDIAHGFHIDEEALTEAEEERIWLYYKSYIKATGEDIPERLQQFLLNYQGGVVEDWEERILQLYIHHVIQTGEDILPLLREKLEQPLSPLTFTTHQTLYQILNRSIPIIQDLTDSSQRIKQVIYNYQQQVRPTDRKALERSLEGLYSDSTINSQEVEDRLILTLKDEQHRLSNAIDYLLILSQKYQSVHKDLPDSSSDLYKCLNLSVLHSSIVKLTNDLAYIRFFLANKATHSSLETLLSNSSDAARSLRRIKTYLDEVTEIGHALKTCFHDVVFIFKTKLISEQGGTHVD